MRPRQQTSSTVAQFRAAGERTFGIHCHGCGRDITASLEGFPDAAPMEEIRLRLRCPCGSPYVTLQADMRVHYERCRRAGQGVAGASLPDDYCVHILAGPRAGTVLHAAEALAATSLAADPASGRRGGE